MPERWNEIKQKNVEQIQHYSGSTADGAVEFYPRYIQLEHTNRCNAQCIMCNHFYLENKGASDISEEIIKKVEPILPYAQVLMLNGDGEPFLCKNIETYIQMYRKYGVKVSTNTNFCYVPEKLWEFFQDGFDLLNISCDGANADTFEYIRKGLKFEQFCQNLERLNRVAPKMRKHLDCVVMRQNILELTEIVEFAHRHNFEKVKFHMLGVNPCIGNQMDSPREFHNLACHQIARAVEGAEKLGIGIEVPNELRGEGRAELLASANDRSMAVSDLNTYGFLNGKDVDLAKKQQEIQRRFPDQSLDKDYLATEAPMHMLEQASYQAGKICQWAVERCYIDLHGNVTTCCYNTRVHFGNLREKSFEEIWNGDLYRAFRRSMEEKRLPEWCRSCNWLKE